MGRPSDYTEEIADEICEAIATSANGIHFLCKRYSYWPKPTTINRWIEEDRCGFRDKYAKAKTAQANYMAEEIINIADDDSKDTITKVNKDGEEYEVCNSEWINRSRLRVDARKWLASKLLPKVYGEKIEKNTGAESQSLLQNLIDKL